MKKAKPDEVPIYKNSKKSVKARVKDLLSRMTLPEKAGQLMQLDGQKVYRELVKKYTIGSLLHINGSDGNEAIEESLKTRLGIPVLLADDGIHGHSFWSGATIFPTQLAMASSWNPELVEKSARVTAAEMRATGLKWTFSPVLCIARDLRWGRVGETFGEDPHLIGVMGQAMIRGYQGRGLNDQDSVLSTAKHFAGYSETIGGRDASEADLTERKLRAWFFPPFEVAAKSGCMTFMTGYQSIDGTPSTLNHWLLTKVLRKEWKFKGVLVTDWNNVGDLVTRQKVCATYAEAAARAVKAGNDIIMACPEFFEACIEAVNSGMLDEEVLDKVVGRMLELKIRMGLFENPGLVGTRQTAHLIRTPENRKLNLELARQSIVLLKNNGVLPLDQTRRETIFVTGQNADNPLNQLGDWSLGSGQMVGPSGPLHPRDSIITVLDGFKMGTKGSKTWNLSKHQHEATTLVLVLGDDLTMVGETKSTATLEMKPEVIAESQVAVSEARNKGQKIILVLINSKPMVLPKFLIESDAIIECFNPGMEGGQAVFEVITGIINPSGKLPVSIPKHVGQLPIYYNQIRGQHGDRYADLDQNPLFAFGYGLSYTKFEIGAPTTNFKTYKTSDVIRVRVDITNRGKIVGHETVQLYVEDEVCSITWATQELKAFQKIELKPGEHRVIEFLVPAQDLSIVDAKGIRRVEPGMFKVKVGSSSRAEDQKSTMIEIS